MNLVLFRKWVCVLLSCVLITNAGCYSHRAARSIETKDVSATYSTLDAIGRGQFVRVHFKKDSGVSQKSRDGLLFRVTPSDLTLMVDGDNFVIPFEQVSRIDFLDKKFDVIKSVGAAGGGVGVLYAVCLLVFALVMSQVGPID